jgi:hypothetical protein
MFVKGAPRPANAGRKAGTPNRVAASIKEVCQRAAPQLVDELLRLAMNSRSEMVRISAARELLDRAYGKPKMSVESELFVGVSLQLRELLARHDGESRSVPSRSNGVLIEHDANGDDRGSNNGSDGLH